MDSKFLHGDRLRKHIVAALEGKRRDLAVAFIGHGALERAGLSSPKGTRIICDLWSGGCNPEAVRQLHKAGVQIRNLRNLHAKVYLGDNAAVVGSANLSSNGFGNLDAPQQWGLEAGILIDNPSELDQIAAWYDAQFANSLDFDPEDDRLDIAWKCRPTPPISVDDRVTNEGLLRHAIVNPSMFDSVGFVFTDKENNKKFLNDAIISEQKRAPERKEEIEIWRNNAFMNWPSNYVQSWASDFIAYHLGTRGNFYANALRLETRNVEEGYVFARRDWKGIAGRLIPGISQSKVEKEDFAIAREIIEFSNNYCDSDFFPSFRSAKELSNWYVKFIGKSGIAFRDKI